MTVIHQIWIGPNPIPHIWMDTIRDFCLQNGFKYTLWREEELKRDLDWDKFPGLYNLYTSIERLSGKANIARLVVLYQCGGIYIDSDCVLMNPSEFVKIIKEKHGVFFAWEKLLDEHINRFSKDKEKHSDLYGKKQIIANSVMGAKKGHPFIKHCMEDVENYSKEHAKKGSWRETGPAFIASMYHKYKNDYDDIKVYPMKKFYVDRWFGIKDPQQHLKIGTTKSIFFQYGYSTNNFDKIFKRLARKTRRR